MRCFYTYPTRFCGQIRKISWEYPLLSGTTNRRGLSLAYSKPWSCWTQICPFAKQCRVRSVGFCQIWVWTVYHSVCDFVNTWICCLPFSIEGWAQDCSNSNIFLKPLFRGNFDPFITNANLGAIAHTSNGTKLSTVYRKKCCNLHNAFMVRRLNIGKNNHLTCYTLAINPLIVIL